MEIIGTICAVIGVVFLIYQFGFLPKKENKEAKDNLLALYNTNRFLIDELIEKLKELSIKDGEILYSPNLSIKGYLTYLEDLRKEELNDELYKKIEVEPLSKEKCSVMLHSLQKQQESFNSSMMYVKTSFSKR